jgi:hypothetical protein
MLAIDDDPARRRDDSAVDLVGASHSWTAGRVCFELRFRTPLAAEANFDLWLLQRAPVRGHPVVSEALRVELSGTTAVATHEMVGRRWFGVEVRVSPARDSVAVEVGGSRGWGIIEPRLSYRWAVDVWTALPEINNGYRDVLEP